MSYPFGIHTDISNADYHASEGYSSSFAKAWYKSTPAHATADRPFRTSIAFDLGTAVHGWALEGVLPVEGPESRRGHAWADAKAEAELLETVALTSGDFAKVELMVNALHGNPHIHKLLAHKERVCEASVFAEHPDTKLRMKARPDLYIESKGLIVDIKTTQSAEPYQFTRQMAQLGYSLQAAWYVRTLQLAGLKAERFLFANVEKEPPYATSIVEVGENLMQHDMEIVERVLSEIKQAEETQSYTTGWPAVHVVDELPPWA